MYYFTATGFHFCFSSSFLPPRYLLVWLNLNFIYVYCIYNTSPFLLPTQRMLSPNPQIHGFAFLFEAWYHYTARLALNLQSSSPLPPMSWESVCTTVSNPLFLLSSSPSLSLSLSHPHRYNLCCFHYLGRMFWGFVQVRRGHTRGSELEVSALIAQVKGDDLLARLMLECRPSSTPGPHPNRSRCLKFEGKVPCHLQLF